MPPQMGRTKTFDEDDALERAMELFWGRGYDGTSMQALVEHVGINRSSLYDTFGDKRALYLAALDRYARLRMTYVTRLMEQDLPVREAFRQLFTEFVEGALPYADRRGCFMANALVDQMPHDARTATALLRHTAEVEAAFLGALTRAQARGEFDPRHDPLRLARYFVNAFNGLRLTVKATTDRAALDDVIAATLSVLD